MNTRTPLTRRVIAALLMVLLTACQTWRWLRSQTNKEIARVAEEWGEEWCYAGLESPGTFPFPPTTMIGPQTEGQK